MKNKGFFLPKGFKFYDENGEYMCRLSRDIFIGETPELDQFEDWKTEKPKTGDIIHENITKYCYNWWC